MKIINNFENKKEIEESKSCVLVNRQISQNFQVDKNNNPNTEERYEKSSLLPQNSYTIEQEKFLREFSNPYHNISPPNQKVSLLN